MPPTKGGKRPPKGGKGKTPSTTAGSTAARVPRKSAPSGTGSNAAAGKSRSSRKRRERWATFVHRTLSQVHDDPPLTISTRAMTIMGSFVEDMFERIHGEAVNVAKINQTKTLTAREVQTSARLLLPGELSKHAMSEGTRAVAKYNSTMLANKESRANHPLVN